MHRVSLIIFIILNSAFALECPDRSSAPLCPDSGTTLLDETYPVQAYVVSYKTLGNRETDKVPTDFIETVFESYDLKSMPQIILAGDSETEFKKIKDRIKSNLESKKVNESDIEKMLSQITLSKGPHYTWQQDYFESFIDPNTGSPVLREVESYKSHHSSVAGQTKKIQSSASLCGVTEGEPIKPDKKSLNVSGEMGGNMEGLPGGLCLIGDNMGKDFAKNFCGDDKNIVQVESSWMQTGHVDEIFKVIPTDIKDGRPSQCQFSLMVASPQKGLSILKSPQVGNENIIQIPGELKDDSLKWFLSSREGNTANSEFCRMIKASKKVQGGSPNTPAKKTRGVFLDLFKNIFMKNAYAQANESCAELLAKTSSYDFAKSIEQDPNLSSINATAEQHIQKDAKKIRERILSRLPECTQYFDTLEVPTIFFSKPDPFVAKGKKTDDKEFKRPGSLSAFFPNSTNNVIMNKTVLFPDSENIGTNNYLQDEMKKRGLKSKFVKTWDYAHKGLSGGGGGNIHCASHSLSYCKARK